MSISTNGNSNTAKYERTRSMPMRDHEEYDFSEGKWSANMSQQYDSNLSMNKKKVSNIIS